MWAKYLIFSFLHLSLCSFVFAQHQESTAVKKSIELFFDGFHKRDSNIIRTVVATDLVLQTIGTDKDGNSRRRTDSFNQFLKSIVSIPDSLKFQEELHDIRVQIDGSMAHAWTPYTFWINGKKSHCGVNSFQLFNDDTSWKIIYLVDTRRKNNCDQ